MAETLRQQINLKEKGTCLLSEPIKFGNDVFGRVEIDLTLLASERVFGVDSSYDFYIQNGVLVVSQLQKHVSNDFNFTIDFDYHNNELSIMFQCEAEVLKCLGHIETSFEFI